MRDQVCNLCGRSGVVHDVRPMTYKLNDGSLVAVDQPGSYCNGCGEVVLEPRDLETTRKALGQLDKGAVNEED